MAISVYFSLGTNEGDRKYNIEKGAFVGQKIDSLRFDAEKCQKDAFEDCRIGRVCSEDFVTTDTKASIYPEIAVNPFTKCEICFCAPLISVPSAAFRHFRHKLTQSFIENDNCVDIFDIILRNDNNEMIPVEELYKSFDVCYKNSWTPFFSRKLRTGSLFPWTNYTIVSVSVMLDGACVTFTEDKGSHSHVYYQYPGEEEK